MKLTNTRNIIRTIASLMLTLAMAVASTSCNGLIYDGDPQCPHGLRIRFVYDYNMLWANAFPSQVHCLTVFVYDAEGNYVTTVTETDRKKLSDENWRMVIDLPDGEYQIVAYGGMNCADASFDFTNYPGPGSLISDLGVELKSSCITDPVGPLHPMFYGRLDGGDKMFETGHLSKPEYQPETITVGYHDEDYRDCTVRMMKDTNDIRVVLHNAYADDTPLSKDDFIFTITDDNSLLGWDNEVLPNGQVEYSAWVTGETEPNLYEDGAPDVGVYAELSTSRLVVGANSYIRIYRASDPNGKPVLSYPLVRLLLQLKKEKWLLLGNQEFLDRESEWDIVIFISDRQTGGNGWITTSIRIKDWNVRINDIDFTE